MDQSTLILVAATITLWIIWMIFPSSSESETAEAKALKAGSYTVTGLIIFAMFYQSTDLTLIALMLLISAPFTIYAGVIRYKSDKKQFISESALLLAMLAIFYGTAWFYHW